MSSWGDELADGEFVDATPDAESHGEWKRYDRVGGGHTLGANWVTAWSRNDYATRYGWGCFGYVCELLDQEGMYYIYDGHIMHEHCVAGPFDSLDAAKAAYMLLLGDKRTGRDT